MMGETPGSVMGSEFRPWELEEEFDEPDLTAVLREEMKILHPYLFCDVEQLNYLGNDDPLVRFVRGGKGEGRCDVAPTSGDAMIAPVGDSCVSASSSGGAVPRCFTGQPMPLPAGRPERLSPTREATADFCREKWLSSMSLKGFERLTLQDLLTAISRLKPLLKTSGRSYLSLSC